MIPNVLKVDSSSYYRHHGYRVSDYQGQKQRDGSRRLCMVSAEPSQGENKGKQLAEVDDGLKREEWELEQRDLFIK